MCRVLSMDPRPTRSPQASSARGLRVPLCPSESGPLRILAPPAAAGQPGPRRPPARVGSGRTRSGAGRARPQAGAGGRRGLVQVRVVIRGRAGRRLGVAKVRRWRLVALQRDRTAVAARFRRDSESLLSFTRVGSGSSGCGGSAELRAASR
jgi:hypothetical protein